MKSRSQRRHDRLTQIARRKKLLSLRSYFHPRHEIADGKLANGHEVSANLTTGRSRKTNTRKGHSNYRNKGGFGEANKYSPHDARQIDSATAD